MQNIYNAYFAYNNQGHMIYFLILGIVIGILGTIALRHFLTRYKFPIEFIILGITAITVFSLCAIPTNTITIIVIMTLIGFIVGLYGTYFLFFLHSCHKGIRPNILVSCFICLAVSIAAVLGYINGYKKGANAYPLLTSYSDAGLTASYLQRLREGKTNEVLELLEEELDRDLSRYSKYFHHREEITNFTGSPIGENVEKEVLKYTCIYRKKYPRNIEEKDSFIKQNSQEAQKILEKIGGTQ